MMVVELTPLVVAERVKYVDASIDESGTVNVFSSPVSGHIRYVFSTVLATTISGGAVVQVAKVLASGSSDTIIDTLPVSQNSPVWVPPSSHNPYAPIAVLQGGENLRISESISGSIKATCWYWDR
jgi:hypothetical protein